MNSLKSAGERSPLTAGVRKHGIGEGVTPTRFTVVTSDDGTGYVMMVGMAPKTEGKQIGVRIPADVLAEIDKRRVNTGQSRAEAIRKMLRFVLKAAEK